MKKELDRLLTLKQVAERLAVCRRTIERLISRGDLPQVVKVGRRSCMLESDVQGFIEGLKRERRR